MTTAHSSMVGMPTKKKDLRRTSAITVGVGTIGGVAAVALSSPLILGATLVATGAWLGRLYVVDKYR